MTEFDHVYWLGGSPCAGKSSIAEQLAAQFDLTLYHCDSEFEKQQSRITAVSTPTIYQMHQLSCDELWLRPVVEQLQTAIRYYAEQFCLIVDDLRQLPTTKPVLVEGAALLPTAVSPYLSQSQKAIWLVPTEPFQRLHYAQRPWIRGVLRECSQPEQAFENWMQRDAAFARWIEREMACPEPAKGAVHRLTSIQVDGTHTIAENSQRVAAALGLAARFLST